MKKHIQFFTWLLSFVFVSEGIIFIFSAYASYLLGAYVSLIYSFFIAFVHFFIAYGLVKRKKWAPHLGIFFQAYLIFNFVISNSRTLLSSALVMSAVTFLSLSAFVTVSLFVLRREFIK